MKQKVLFNWSTGKDSALALYKLLQDPVYEVCTLLCSISAPHQRVSMHGVRVDLLEAQVALIGLPLEKMYLPESPGMDTYEQVMKDTLRPWCKKGVEWAAFGDVFLEDLRAYRETKLAQVGLKGLFPLWKQPTDVLLREFLDCGFKSVVTCVNERYLDKSFAGRIIDEDFIKDLPPDVDPCGENGEFHTFVFDGPIFKSPVPWQKGELHYKQYHTESGKEEYNSGFWFCDLQLL